MAESEGRSEQQSSITIPWLQKFAKETPLHGLPHISAAHSYFGSGFWTVFFLALVAITVIECMTHVVVFFSVPTQTIVKVETKAAISLPNITICLPLYAQYMMKDSSWAAMEETFSNVLNNTDPMTFIEDSWVPEVTECMDNERNCTYANCLGTADYNGSKDTTVMGIPCQNWSEDNSPRRINPFYLQPMVQDQHHLKDNNFCRLAASEQQPWCYTTNGTYTWDYCYETCDTTHNKSDYGRLLLALTAAHFYHTLYWLRNFDSPQRVAKVTNDLLEQAKTKADKGAKHRMIAALLNYTQTHGIAEEMLFEKFQLELCKVYNIQVWRMMPGSAVNSRESAYKIAWPCRNWMNRGLKLNVLTEHWACFLLPLSVTQEAFYQEYDETIVEFAIKPLFEHHWQSLMQEYNCSGCHTPIRVELADQASGWISELGFRMNVSQNQNVLIELRETIELLPEKHNCDDKSVRTTWRQDEICLEQCAMDNMVERCDLDCVLFSFYGQSHVIGGKRVCKWQEINNCSKDTNDMREKQNRCQQKCRFPCTRHVYVPHLKENYGKNTNTAKSTISLWFQTFSYIRIMEQRSMGLQDLTASIGGELGLWIGGSLVAVVHIFYFWTAQFLNRCRTRIHQQGIWPIPCRKEK